MSTPDVTLALPGRWWRIVLHDPQAAQRSVRAYVNELAGRRDDLAQSRAELRADLDEAVAEARRIGGLSMYMSSEVAPGVPTSISLTTYKPELPVQVSMLTSAAVAADALAASLRSTAPGDAVEVWAEDGLGVVRSVDRSHLTSESGDQAATLRVDYWLLRDGDPDTRLLTFSSPVIWEDLADALVVLFDAIVATVEMPGIPEAIDGDLSPSTP